MFISIIYAQFYELICMYIFRILQRILQGILIVHDTLVLMMKLHGVVIIENATNHMNIYKV